MYPRAFRNAVVPSYCCKHRLLCSRALEAQTNTIQHSDENCAVRKSPLHIQMLSEGLYRQVFKEASSGLPEVNENDLKKIQKHLERFDLWNKQTTTIPDVNFKLPHIEGIYKVQLIS